MSAAAQGETDVPRQYKLQNPYRVTKGFEAQKTSFEGSNLTKKFTKSIDHDRTRLAKEAEEELDMAEKSLNDRLEAIHESMQGMLVKTEEREAKFFAPISEEQLKLSKPTSSGRTVFTLGERMEEFDKIVRRHREGLEKLWNEWADIQTELVALAVEVFGPQSIQIQDDVTPKLDRAVQSATLKHERNMEAVLGPLNELKALKQSVLQATQQTIETSEQIEQAWNEAFTKELETIKRAMKNLAG